MRQTQKLSRIVIALMAISHDRIDYPAGSVFEVPEKDVVFLKMAKCVRDPTADELKAYEERQTLATVTATQPDTTDHAGLQPQPPSDSEPDTSGGLQGHVIIDELSANKPEPVEVLDPENVEAPQTESVEPIETVEPERAQVVEVETVEPEAITNPYKDWLKKDLNDELDKRGIERDVTRNDDLEALLIADDQAKAAE